MTSDLPETQPKTPAAHNEQNAEKNTEKQYPEKSLIRDGNGKDSMVQEPASCYAAEPQENPLLSPGVSPRSPSVRISVVPVASRLELALEDAKKYPKRCTRWYDREELVNKGALEIMLDEYHSVKLLAIALNCSEHMVYRAIRHHGITYPRAYPSVKAKKLLRL